MRRPLAVLAAVAALVGALTLLSPTPPAQAVPHDVCTGLGLASFSSPFVYPTQPTGGIHPHSAAFSLSLSVGLCLPSSTTLHAFGNIHGWCSLFTGTGTTSVGDRFAVIGIGETFILTGQVTGFVVLTPDVIGGHECFTGASSWLARGVAVRSSCNVVDVEPTASIPIPVTSTSVPDFAHVSTSGHLPVFTKVCV
jgi:hypothetical protein